MRYIMCFTIFLLCIGFIINITSLNMSLLTPTLTNFTIAPRVIYRDTTFQLIDPSSNNTNPSAVFTFTSSNRNVADISERTVRIISTGETTIGAIQTPTTGYTTGQIYTRLVVNPVITSFTITPKEWQDSSFNLQDPYSNSPGSFTFENLTPTIISVSNRIVTLKHAGRAQIKAIQAAAGVYPSDFIIATFDVLTSIVRIGTQNQIDLSWNIPTENGATIKNYFFYKEERHSTVSPAPSVSTIIGNTVGTNSSYYSHSLPVPYSTQVISANGSPAGIDLNFANTSFNITTLPQYTNSNYFDIGYYGEIEVNWEYHSDKPIVELAPNTVATTTMTLSIYKEASRLIGDKRIDLFISAQRNYDSVVNCYGPMPQNNNKTMTDIFTITFPGTTDSAASRELKYLKHSDVISGRVTISSNTYSPADAPTTSKEYSILVKSIRIAPFRFPITRDFTSLGFGAGSSLNGFSVSTFNALSAPYSSDVSGVLYHMPKMTRPMTDYNKASWTFSWKYAANLAKLTTDISFLPLSSGTITNLDIPFNMRIRGYSRPYAKTASAILDASYTTTSPSAFLTNVSNTQYNTRQLFDVSFNDSASYNKIFSAAAAAASSHTFNISAATGFSPYTDGIDYSHSQFVFLFQMTILDPSYNAYFRTMNTEANSFQVTMLSQTFTPYQEYRFAGPDPTLATSSALTSSTNTLYNIADYYTPIIPFYSFFDLLNGVFYSYRISSYNMVGTSAFSELLTRRCGSLPNTIVNRVNSLGADTYTIESERTSNRVNIYWEKPSFTGYEIQYFVIQMTIDVSGRWVNSFEYTPELTANDLSFNIFNDSFVPTTVQTATEYSTTISQYTYNSSASQQRINTLLGLNTPITGSLLNGYKYYFRLASVNELGYSAYSSVLSGIPFARPDNSPIEFVGDQTIGDKLAILTWKIPQDDAGSPILNYIIDYEEVEETITPSGAIVKKYSNKVRYIQDAIENGFYKQPNSGYPFDDFIKVYSGYKKFSSLTSDKQTDLITLRNKISNYIIHPRSITLIDADKSFNSSSTDLSNNIVLSYTNTSFTYVSQLLKQNVFDLSNIQLKWYYIQDMNGGGLWPNDVSVSFQLSVRAHLVHNSSNRTRDVSGIFDISGTYDVNSSKMSVSDVPIYKYINYLNGNVIENGGGVPVTYVKFKTLSPPTLYRIDHTNDNGYYLKLEYTIRNISRSDYRFLFYSGQVIVNGVAPVRTFSGLNTEFTVTLKNNIYTPFSNGKKYLFTVTPFNINAYFPDPSKDINYGSATSQTAFTMGTEYSDPITDMSYSLISTSQGGKVLFQWKYSSKPRYYINIQIPPEYAKEDVFPQEYPLLLQPDGNSRSILTPSLDPINGIVSYTIPSNLQSDIAESNAQTYLKSGRGYHISVSPVQSFINNQGTAVYIPAPARNMYLDGTYIIPYRTPLRPLELSSQANNGSVDLKWRLPNLNNDPNFYKTDITSTYYQYKYFTLDRRVVSAAEPVWTVVSNDIIIPTQANGGVAGYQAQYTVGGLANEQPHQFRIRTVIMNEYTGQRTESEYTYMSIINNIPVLESSGVTVVPSVYPYKPSIPLLRFADRVQTATGMNNGLTILFDYPTYTGNADYYECDIYYTGVGSFGAVWYGIFDVNNGIADILYNISLNGGLFTTNGKLRTTSAVIGVNQSITVVCRNTVLSYGIRIRMYPRKNGLDGVYPSGDSLYSEYSNVDYIDT